MSSADAMELRIPADAAYLSVARMFAGSVAKTFELDPSEPRIFASRSPRSALQPSRPGPLAPPP